MADLKKISEQLETGMKEMEADKKYGQKVKPLVSKLTENIRDAIVKSEGLLNTKPEYLGFFLMTIARRLTLKLNPSAQKEPVFEKLLEKLKNAVKPADINKIDELANGVVNNTSGGKKRKGGGLEEFCRNMVNNFWTSSQPGQPSIAGMIAGARQQAIIEREDALVDAFGSDYRSALAAPNPVYIPAAQQDRLRNAGINVERLQGPDRNPDPVGYESDFTFTGIAFLSMTAIWALCRAFYSPQTIEEQREARRAAREPRLNREDAAQIEREVTEGEIARLQRHLGDQRRNIQDMEAELRDQPNNADQIRGFIAEYRQDIAATEARLAQLQRRGGKGGKRKTLRRRGKQRKLKTRKH